jgi:hypothetical protein
LGGELMAQKICQMQNQVASPTPARAVAELSHSMATSGVN